MTKIIAAALAALVLAACSDSEETASPSETAQDGTTIQQPTSPSAETPCPESETQPEPGGPKVTPSPVEVCEGAYECLMSSSLGSGRKTSWFGFDGTSCTFGQTVVFLSDGEVRIIGRDETWGHWTGDYTTFTMTYVNNPHHQVDTCTRIPNQ